MEVLAHIWGGNRVSQTCQGTAPPAWAKAKAAESETPSHRHILTH